jgi:hypothetical protein
VEIVERPSRAASWCRRTTCDRRVSYSWSVEPDDDEFVTFERCEHGHVVRVSRKRYGRRLVDAIEMLT